METYIHLFFFYFTSPSKYDIYLHESIIDHRKLDLIKFLILNFKFSKNQPIQFLKTTVLLNFKKT